MFQTTINWQPYRRWKHKRIAPWKWDWLVDPSSMTQKLMLNCVTVAIDLIRQEWSLLSCNETKRLGFNEYGPTMVREVRIMCDAQVWMCAGTFISRKNLQGVGGTFKNLGTRPLGELLFKKSWQRTQLDLAPIKCGQYKFEFLSTSFSHHVPFLWGRRSYFKKDNNELMLIEVFTQQMWESLGN
jgi:chorismate--pyruvate lyase